MVVMRWAITIWQPAIGLMFLGLYLGGRIRARLSEAHFSTLIFAALAAFGAYLILGAFVSLP